MPFAPNGDILAVNDSANGNWTYTYDDFNRLSSANVTGQAYTYADDRFGNRVEKSSGKIYWLALSGAEGYGAGTEILDESDTSGNFTNEYVFFGGKRVAMRNVSSGTIYYYEEDMLGSSRTMVQAGQTSLCYDGDFYPFGGERIITNTCTQNYKFEGKERDTETGNDDFGARYYTSRLGRWLSADWSAVPAPVPYANLTNPQTLNLYAMVSDNPETFADLDGHLIQGGPYNLETADFSEGGPLAGNCDYMGGDCSQNGFGDENSGIPDWYRSEVSAQQQTAPATGEGSQANLARRAAIAKSAEDARTRSALTQVDPYGSNECSRFVSDNIKNAGAKAEFDHSGRPPVAGEWANRRVNIPGWRSLAPGVTPSPGDVAAVHILNPHPGATGDSAIVVMRGNRISAIEAGDHGIEYNSNFIHGYYGVVYWRYRGD